MSLGSDSNHGGTPDCFFVVNNQRSHEIRALRPSLKQFLSLSFKLFIFNILQKRHSEQTPNKAIETREFRANCIKSKAELFQRPQDQDRGKLQMTNGR